MQPSADFRTGARRLEAAYLESDDPMVQSGFSGGRARWVAERSPLVDAIHRDGSILDVGCANGLLAQDVVTWAGSKLDLSPAEMWCDWLRRLSSWLEPGGRLIIGSYGSRSRSLPPVDVPARFEECGLRVAGSSHGGDPPLSWFAWSMAESRGELFSHAPGRHQSLPLSNRCSRMKRPKAQ